MGNLYSGWLQTAVSVVAPVCVVFALAACSNDPQKVDFTIYPKKTSYPDGSYEQAGTDYKPKVIPSSAYYNRGDPENLLDVANETVNIRLNSRAALRELALMVERDPPNRAELGCQQADSLCMQARETLGQHGVPVQFTDNSAGATLYYERVTARDCENRFVENKNEKHALNAPTFGCSVAANTVQMVGDKRQFSNPRLVDFMDGKKAVQNMERYSKPSKSSDGQNNSLLKMIPLGSSSGR